MSGAVGPVPAPLRAVRALRRAIAAVSALMAHVAGWAYFVCALFMTFDIVARAFFGFSSQATVEITGYTLAGGIAWSLAHTLFRRAHIRVDVFVTRLPVRIRAPLHILSLALLTALTALIVWSAWELVDESALFQAHDNSALRIEMVWPQGIWAFGISIFLLACLVLMAEAVLALVAGQGAVLDGLLGSRTLEDETEEALEAVAMAHEGEHR
ncbi:TRAP transporter small permease [Roseomonas sp. HJA6]|uniref:TRAP transporter small permease protein n=1 Tax=Roseomonas alba TaxID=2846776 RepID=A0ABS7A6H6_9PROT|nr:TRAP transporter small permease [Neoroseomonas alba]